MRSIVCWTQPDRTMIAYWIFVQHLLHLSNKKRSNIIMSRIEMAVVTSEPSLYDWPDPCYKNNVRQCFFFQKRKRKKKSPTTLNWIPNGTIIYLHILMCVGVNECECKWFHLRIWNDCWLNQKWRTYSMYIQINWSKYSLKINA